MIKEILILTYILIVLVISSLVRAEVLFPPMVAHGIVQQAVIDQNGILDVRGQINSACEGRPAILVKGIDKTQNVATLDVVEVAGRQVCDDKELVNFDIVYDLKEIPLEVNQTYTIEFASSSQRLTYKAPGSLGGFDLYKTTRQNFTGTIVSADDPPSGFVLQNGDGIVRVVSPDLDLAKFTGEAVSLMGYPVDTASLNGGDSLAVDSGQAETIIVPVEVVRVEPVVLVE